jgi:prepilin signal peptidase PulO-like enzyme (type II secretory pathway)
MGIGIGFIFLGLLGGYLVNYLSDVLPSTRKLSHPVCWNCSSEYSVGDYLLLNRCKNCGKSRSPRTYFILILIPVIGVYLWLLPPRQIELPLAFLLLIFLLLVATIDIEHRLILHMTSIAGAFISLGIGIHLHGVVPTLIGGAAGYGVMLLFYFFGDLFVRYRSKKRNEPTDEVALGFGDVNLAGITGLLLGWPVIIPGLLFTILAGGLISLLIVVFMLVRRQYQAFYAIPYGPFMILSIFYLLFRP